MADVRISNRLPQAQNVIIKDATGIGITKMIMAKGQTGDNFVIDDSLTTADTAAKVREGYLRQVTV